MGYDRWVKLALFNVLVATFVIACVAPPAGSDAGTTGGEGEGEGSSGEGEGASSEGEGEGPTTEGEGEGGGEGEGSVDDPSTWALIVHDSFRFDIVARTDGSLALVADASSASTLEDERGRVVAVDVPVDGGCIVVDVDSLGSVQWQLAIDATASDGISCARINENPDGTLAVEIGARFASHVIAGSFSADLPDDSACLVHLDGGGVPTGIEVAPAGTSEISFAAWADGSTFISFYADATGTGTTEWRDPSGAVTAQLDLGIRNGPAGRGAQVIPLDDVPPRVAIVATGTFSGNAPFASGPAVSWFPAGDGLVGVLDATGFEWAYTIDGGGTNPDRAEFGVYDGSALTVFGGFGFNNIVSIRDGSVASPPATPPSSQASVIHMSLDGAIAGIESVGAANSSGSSEVAGSDGALLAIVDDTNGAETGFLAQGNLVSNPLPYVVRPLVSTGNTLLAGALDLDEHDADLRSLVPDALVTLQPRDVALLRPSLELH
jgi:hypothetical protein